MIELPPINTEETAQDVMARAAVAAGSGVSNGLPVMSDEKLLQFAQRLRLQREEWLTAEAAGKRPKRKKAEDALEGEV